MVRWTTSGVGSIVLELDLGGVRVRDKTQILVASKHKLRLNELNTIIPAAELVAAASLTFVQSGTVGNCKPTPTKKEKRSVNLKND